MSSSPESNNRSIPPSTPSTTPQRDTDYYFTGGTAVFLVDGTLFKLPPLLLASDSLRVTYKPRNSPPVVLFDCSDDCATGTPGESDKNPVVVPYVRRTYFRYLLHVLLGRPGNPRYMELLTDAQHKSKHSQALFLRYLNLGHTAYLFGLSDLSEWALSQLGLVLESARTLAQSKWDKRMTLRILRIVDDMLELKPDVAFELQAFIRLFFSVPAPSSSKGTVENLLHILRPSSGTPSNQQLSNIDTCVVLYQESSRLGEPTRSRILGYTFVTLLSLGHNSALWKEQLTRDERATFYIAQTHLLNLQSNKSLALGWLEDPKNAGILRSTCSPCSQRFSSAWDASFGLCGTLNSSVPLEDVCKLMHLPHYRQVFSEAVRNPAWRCDQMCGKKILRSIDVALDSLFNKKLPALYKEFAG